MRGITAMLSEKALQKIQQLLTDIDVSGESLNVAQIQGLFYAVVITPEPIAPKEWLPIIFNKAITDEISVESMQQLLGEIFNVYNHYNKLRLNGTLHFPYNPELMTPDLFDVMLDWSWGFFLGLQLRPAIWSSGVVAKEMNLKPEEDPIKQSVKVIQFLVDADFEDLEFSNQLKQEIPDGYDAEAYAISMCLNLLPTVVENIQQFADEMQARTVGEPIVKSQTVQSTRVGRNDPCPCGSGKKYKKCCLQ
jgi:uncharacterized protein